MTVLAANPHQLAYIDGASRCTACGKLGLDISICGITECAGAPPETDPKALTEAESERLWTITRSLAHD